MQFVLIISFIIRSGLDASTTQVSFPPARYYTTYDNCMRAAPDYVKQEAARHSSESDRVNGVIRYNCVPMIDDSSR